MRQNKFAFGTAWDRSGNFGDKASAREDSRFEQYHPSPPNPSVPMIDSLTHFCPLKILIVINTPKPITLPIKDSLTHFSTLKIEREKCFI